MASPRTKLNAVNLKRKKNNPFRGPFQLNRKNFCEANRSLQLILDFSCFPNIRYILPDKSFHIFLLLTLAL